MAIFKKPILILAIIFFLLIILYSVYGIVVSFLIAPNESASAFKEFLLSKNTRILYFGALTSFIWWLSMRYERKKNFSAENIKRNNVIRAILFIIGFWLLTR